MCTAGALQRQGDLRLVAHVEEQCPAGCDRRTDDRRVFDGDRRFSHQAGQPGGPLRYGRLDGEVVTGAVMVVVAAGTSNNDIIYLFIYLFIVPVRY